VSMRTLAEKVLELTGSASKMVLRPIPADDPRQRQPDISRAREVLDWEPTVALDEGLRRTITYFDDLLSNNEVRARLAVD